VAADLVATPLNAELTAAAEKADKAEKAAEAAAVEHATGGAPKPVRRMPLVKTMRGLL